MISWLVVILWLVYGVIFFVAGGLFMLRLVRLGRVQALE